jgi:hypothetical protein
MLALLGLKLHRLHSKVVGAEAIARRFTPDLDVPMAQPHADSDGHRATVTELDDGWRCVTNHNRVFQLFDVLDSDFGGHKVTYRADLRCRDVEGRAYLELWCRIPGVGEFTSKGVHNAVDRTKTWQPCETSIHVKHGYAPDRLRLCLTIEGRGIVEMRDIALVKQPLTRVPHWQRIVLTPAWIVWRSMRRTTLVVLNLPLIIFSFWVQAPGIIGWWPRGDPKIGKRKF